MLINILGMWIMSTAILRLEPYGANCYIVYVKDYIGKLSETHSKSSEGKSCDEIAAEINQQIRWQQKGITWNKN